MAPSDDSDDGDLEVWPKQRRVQNELYMNDEDEEEDGEEQEGSKVMVRDVSFVYNSKPSNRARSLAQWEAGERSYDKLVMGF